MTIGGPAVGVTTTTPGQNGPLTFAGTAGQQVTVHVTGNTMGTLTVRVFKPDGSQLTTAWGGASFNLPQATLPTTGTYSILLDPSGTGSGSANISVTSP